MKAEDLEWKAKKMSQTLRLLLPDALFKAIEQQAAVQKTDAASVATSALQQHFHRDEETNGSRICPGSLEELFGCIDLGHPTGLDNEALDADLAKEYSRDLLH
jgi:hypothetical protein